METLVANLVGKTRRDTFDGREFIVAPMTLIVPGVLNGSKGPLFYPPEEIAKNADAWNGIPLVVDHPHKDGSPVSARSPSVLNGQGIGHLFEARADGKLTAEGWFDVEKVQRIAPEILQSLREGKPIELSTGLFTTNEPAGDGAVDNGKPYSFIARDYRPDHLAILLDSVGACGVGDGCGVLVNSLNGSTLGKINQLLGITDNELSHDDLRSNLSVMLKERFGSGSTEIEDPWVVDTFQNKVIYAFGGKHFRLGFTRTKDKVSLSDLLPVEVTRITQWKAVTNEGGHDMPFNENQKKEIVDNLIANTCCWEEGDREVLNKFSDEKLVLMRDHDKKEKQRELVANAAEKGFKDSDGNSHVFDAAKGEWDTKKKEPDPDSVVNKESEKKPQTTDDWMKSAPKEIQSAVRNAMSIENREKAQIIDRLTANLNDESKETVVNRLKDRPLEELRDLALLNSEPAEQVAPVASYLGATSPIDNAQSKLDQSDILVLPVMNQGEKQTA